MNETWRGGGGRVYVKEGERVHLSQNYISLLFLKSVVMNNK